jgi:hypothetical protein
VNPHCPTADRADGEVAPILSGPPDAARAISLSAPPHDAPAVVALLCDPDHRLILAMVVEGATAEAVPRCLDLVLQVAERGGIAGVVVGIVRGRRGPLGRRQAGHLAGLVDRCGRAGVDLLDVLVLSPGGWESVWHLAAEPTGGEDGGS